MRAKNDSAAPLASVLAGGAGGISLDVLAGMAGHQRCRGDCNIPGAWGWWRVRGWGLQV